MDKMANEIKIKKQKIEYKINKNDEEELNQITISLKEERKKNKILKEENEQLLKDIITIKTNIKSLIPCLPQNRLHPFPSLEELTNHILNFIKIDSTKFYNRLKKIKLFSIEIIIIYYKEIFKKCQEIIDNHFSSIDTILNNKFKNIDLIKPLKSIINNSYQVNWKNIYNKLTTEDNLKTIIDEIKQNIINKPKENPNIIINYSSSFINHLKEYIKSLIEIFLKCYISRPQINFDITKIGKLEEYNSLTNESLFNENMIRGEECYIIIPSFYYNDDNRFKKFEINNDKIIKNLDKIDNNYKENNRYNVNKNEIKTSVNNGKVNNYYYRNNTTKYSMNNKINFGDKKNYENKYYDRKKYSEIYFNSKSYINRNFNYNNLNFNNYSISNNFNDRKIHYNKSNKRYFKNKYKKEKENRKDKRKYIYSDDEDNDF